MPRGDGTGPMGAGPRTGGGKGFCARPAGFADRRRDHLPYGQGGRALRRGGASGGANSGAGFRAGRGLRWMSSPGAPSGPETDLESLKARAGALEDELARLRQRIRNVESGEKPQP